MNSHQLKLPLGRYLGKEEQTTRVKKAKNEGGQTFKGLCCGSGGKESACNVGDLGSIPGLGRSPGEGKGYPLQYSGLENSMDCIVHGVAESDVTEQLPLYFRPSKYCLSHNLSRAGSP